MDRIIKYIFLFCTLIVLTGCGRDIPKVESSDPIVQETQPVTEAIVTDPASVPKATITETAASRTDAVTIGVTAAPTQTASLMTRTTYVRSTERSSSAAVVITTHAATSEQPQQTTSQTAAIVPTAPVTETVPSPTSPQGQPSLGYHEYKSCAVYSADSGTYLYVDNTNSLIYPASMTKLLTACVALYYVDAYTVCDVGTELDYVNQGSSLCYLYRGDSLTMLDLVTGLLLSSGNDAAYTIAVNTARIVSGDPYMYDYDAIQYFCGLMNQYAKNIGMTSSNFTTPDGWDEYYQYTTVSDLITLTNHASNYWIIDTVTGWSSTTVISYNGTTYEWHNSNRLLHNDDIYYCPYAVGTKTGSTGYAGYCLIAKYNVNESTYYTVVAGCPTDEERYELTLDLFNTYVLGQ